MPVSQEARAQSQEHERRLADFLRKVENTRMPTTPHVNALRASTPRICPEFGYNTSPVGRMWDPRAVRCRTSGVRAQWITPKLSGTRANTLPHTSSARTEEQHMFRDTRTRDHSHERNARSRDLQFRLDEQPTHEDDRRNSGDIQQSSYHPGNTSSFARQSSSPKVPTFDGTNTAQFRPWIIQFEAIARHQGWTAGERVVRLVSSLTGPAANLLIGMTLGQLDDYNFLRTRLSCRYDPPEREEAHRAELRARTRRRNESADEFAENIKIWHSAHTH